MTRLADAWAALLALVDLCGRDRRPSFSKLMTVAVFVASLWLKMFSPWVALLVIAAAFGRTTLLALINRGGAPSGGEP